MSDRSKIEWTEATWNPVTGCTKVSPGCDHCYAETLSERFRGTPGHHFEAGFDLMLRPERLHQPLRWAKPRRVFVNSMSDLFHDDIPDEYIARVFAVMAQTPQHTYQVLTKRHARMRSLLNRVGAEWSTFTGAWPLPNVWLGVSVEDQKWADIRILALLETPAAVRWLSCEPLLGPIQLGDALFGRSFPDTAMGRGIGGQTMTAGPHVDWVVVGGESGRDARPMHPDWARSLRDQCASASVPFFFKQWGEWHPIPPADGQAPFRIVPEYGHDKDGPFERGWGMRCVGKRAAGRVLDGRTWDEYPS